MLKKRFDKAYAEPRHNRTVLSVDMFSHKEVDSDLGSGWGFLKAEMKIEPHKHPVKEMYVFTQGKGFMQVGTDVVPVQKGDAVYIPPNAMHTAWNSGEDDLEFVFIVFDTRPLTFLIQVFEALTDVVANRFTRGRMNRG